MSRSFDMVRLRRRWLSISSVGRQVGTDYSLFVACNAGIPAFAYGAAAAILKAKGQEVTWGAVVGDGSLFLVVVGMGANVFARAVEYKLRANGLHLATMLLVAGSALAYGVSAGLAGTPPGDEKLQADGTSAMTMIVLLVFLVAALCVSLISSISIVNHLRSQAQQDEVLDLRDSTVLRRKVKNASPEELKRLANVAAALSSDMREVELDLRRRVEVDLRWP